MSYFLSNGQQQHVYCKHAKGCARQRLHMQHVAPVFSSAGTCHWISMPCANFLVPSNCRSVRCTVSWCVAELCECCNVVQRGAVWGSVAQFGGVRCNKLECVAVRCSVLPFMDCPAPSDRRSVCCGVLQCVAVC